MPNRPKTICNAAGCGAATHGRYCAAHVATHAKAAAWRDNTASAHTRGYGAVWRRLRTMVLARDPVCTVCGREPATAVDHVTPKSLGGDDALENLRGICRGCHGTKTAREGNAAKAAARPEGRTLRR